MYQRIYKAPLAKLPLQRHSDSLKVFKQRRDEGSTLTKLNQKKLITDCWQEVIPHTEGPIKAKAVLSRGRPCLGN